MFTNRVLLTPALRVGVLTVLLVGCVLAFGAVAAQALDDWGPLGQIDGRDGSLAELGGVAVSPDGSTIYAVDVGQPTKTDDCGQPYTPIVVHRYVLSADRHSVVASSSVTLPGDLPPLPSGDEKSVPIAVATDASGQQVVLVGFDADHDADGDGVCTPVTDPALLTELDATTLATVRTLDRAALGGDDVERISVLPGTGGAPDSVWMLGVPSPATSGPVLTRWSGVPGDDSTAATASYPIYHGVIPAGTCTAPPATANGLQIAADPDGGVVLQVGGGVWVTCGNLNGNNAAVFDVSAGGVLQQPPLEGWINNAAIANPLPLLNTNTQGGAYPLAVDPASGDIYAGEYANSATSGTGPFSPSPGIQELDPSGDEIRAWGPQPPAVIAGDGTNPDCQFLASPGFPSPSSGLYLAAAPGLVVAANNQPYNAAATPDTAGPLISWFGAGGIAPRCLLTPRPTASLNLTPASGAKLGQTLTIDASGSTANTTPAINADNTLTYQFEHDGSGYGAPTSNPVLNLPLTHSGTYPLGVLVTDAYGQQAEMRVDYTVTEPPPEAVITASDLNPTVGETVTFDGSASHGTIQRYQYDLDGSGNFATDNLSNPMVSYKFSQAGPVNVGLRVTNDQGEQATTTVTVNVQPAPAPPAIPPPATDALDPLSLASSPGQDSATSKPLVTLSSAQVPSKAGRLKVTVDCLLGGAHCGGTLWLADSHGRRISSRVRFSAAAGLATSAQPRLSTADRELLRRRPTLSARVEARMLGPNGAVIIDHAARVLHRPAAWAPKRKAAKKLKQKRGRA